MIAETIHSVPRLKNANQWLNTMQQPWAVWVHNASTDQPTLGAWLQAFNPGWSLFEPTTVSIFASADHHPSGPRINERSQASPSTYFPASSFYCLPSLLLCLAKLPRTLFCVLIRPGASTAMDKPDQKPRMVFGSHAIPRLHS